jgi:hypothetical protein
VHVGLLHHGRQRPLAPPAIDLRRGATRAVTNLDLGASEIAYATALSSTGRLGSFGRSSSALEIKPFRFSLR